MRRCARSARSSAPTCSRGSTPSSACCSSSSSSPAARRTRCSPASSSRNSVIGIVQELRARKTLNELAVLNAPKARVVRDGTAEELGVSQVVADELLELQTGRPGRRRRRGRAGDRARDRRVAAHRRGRTRRQARRRRGAVGQLRRRPARATTAPRTSAPSRTRASSPTRPAKFELAPSESAPRHRQGPALAAAHHPARRDPAVHPPASTIGVVARGADRHGRGVVSRWCPPGWCC